MTAALRERPDWTAAADTLIRGCAGLPDGEARVRWIEGLCRTLGDQLYPAFLRVLCTVGEQGAPPAQRAVAAALTEALESGRLPSGRHGAWGAVAGQATRRHGPLEFLCAWYLHPPGSDALSASGFDRAARALLGLVAHEPQAHALYRARLRNAADDPLEGAWTRADRDALRALAQAWRPGAGPGPAVDAFLQAARAGNAPGWAPGGPWGAPG